MNKIIFQKNGSEAEELFALKANLHTHSVNSDGLFTPDELISMYKEAGYDVLAFTDHRFVNKVSGYESNGMTLICGVELHPVGPRGIKWHILALGVQEDFDNVLPETGQEAVDSVIANGGERN